eukprot:5702271-Ditylum_brightwellii.AAC.1
MECVLNTQDNDDIAEDIDNDDGSTDTTTTNGEEQNEPDDESTSFHQLPMRPYRMNVKLSIPYISTLEHFDTFQV